jgi:hypothetical protein
VCSVYVLSYIAHGAGVCIYICLLHTVYSMHVCVQCGVCVTLCGSQARVYELHSRRADCRHAHAVQNIDTACQQRVVAVAVGCRCSGLLQNSSLIIAQKADCSKRAETAATGTATGMQHAPALLCVQHTL